MNVNLGETLDRFVEELVKSGNYQSQSEVVREGLRLLRDREDFKKMRLEELRREVKIGLDQANRGEMIPADEVFAELKRMSEERRRKGKK